MNRYIIEPIIVDTSNPDVKKRGIAYCPRCEADIHGQGKMSNCPHCGQALNWNKYVRK